MRALRSNVDLQHREQKKNELCVDIQRLLHQLAEAATHPPYQGYLSALAAELLQETYSPIAVFKLLECVPPIVDRHAFLRKESQERPRPSSTLTNLRAAAKRWKDRLLKLSNGAKPHHTVLARDLLASLDTHEQRRLRANSLTVDILEGRLTELVELAQKLAAMDSPQLHLRFQVTVCVSLGEHLPSDCQRDLLWQAFGVPVRVTYTAPNGLALARECDVPGWFHVDRERAFIERAGNRMATHPDELLFTVLDGNLALVRVRSGLRGQVWLDGSCPCGYRGTLFQLAAPADTHPVRIQQPIEELGSRQPSVPLGHFARELYPLEAGS